MTERLIELLREIRPNYGDVGSRDVDVRKRQEQIDEAIALLAHGAQAECGKRSAELLGPSDEGFWSKPKSAAPVASSVADTAGVKLMPPRMTPEMKSAFVKAARDYAERTGGNNPDAMYEAAFAAAPTPAIDAAGVSSDDVLGKLMNIAAKHIQTGYLHDFTNEWNAAIAKESGK
ncbi:hypothetical protein B0G84_5029 [Paraburkholderia sp. BL8N3]|nr:hypothetical protein [Paraburkholderia sp. BL8N3]TCK39689.1 hypothetical protein B0G84_5029 [Paraburkholderia sp. BL8N3]